MRVSMRSTDRSPPVLCSPALTISPSPLGRASMRAGSAERQTCRRAPRGPPAGPRATTRRRRDIANSTSRSRPQGPGATPELAGSSRSPRLASNAFRARSYIFCRVVGVLSGSLAIAVSSSERNPAIVPLRAVPNRRTPTGLRPAQDAFLRPFFPTLTAAIECFTRRGARQQAATKGLTAARRGARDGGEEPEIVWERPFLSGEQNMSHADRQSRSASLQVSAVPPARQRPRALLRRGDAVVQRRDQGGKGRRVRDQAEPFGLPLRNRLSAGKAEKVGQRRSRSEARSSPGRFRWRGGSRWFRPRTARRR